MTAWVFDPGRWWPVRCGGWGVLATVRRPSMAVSLPRRRLPGILPPVTAEAARTPRRASTPSRLPASTRPWRDATRAIVPAKDVNATTAHNETGRHVGRNLRAASIGVSAAGQVTVDYPNGESVVGSFDLLGRQTSVLDAVGNLTEFVYDDFDRVVTEKVTLDGSTEERSYQYDITGLVTSVSDYDDSGMTISTLSTTKGIGSSGPTR